jgi:hypothetical protein
MIMKSLSLVILLLPCISFACSTSDVEVSKLRGESNGGYLYVYGVIKHKCSEPVGVQLKLTAYNKKGDIVDDRELWPASVRNIRPSTPYPFKLILETGGVKGTLDVDVIRVKQWKQ